MDLQEPANTDQDLATPDLLYGLNDRLPPTRMLLYGLQWLCIFLPILTMVSAVAAEFLGLSPAARLAFFQRLMILTGLLMTVQTLWGHQLPLLDGPAGALLLCLATLAPVGQPAIGGGMIIGAGLVFLCGLLGLMRYLTRLFTDRVVGVILMLIALTLLPFILPLLTGAGPGHPHGRPFIFFLALALTGAMVLMHRFLKGLLKSLSLFLGIGLGTLVFALLGLVDLAEIRTAPWLAWPRPAWGPGLSFDLGAAISFALAYLAVLVNATGSVVSLGPIVRAGQTGRRLDRGLIFTGLGGILAGAAGVVGTVPYAVGPGVVAVTRVGSRFAVTASGLLLLVLAFLGKATAVLTAVPAAVVAAALLTAMAAMVGVSLDIIRRHQDHLSERDYLVVGLPILLGTLASTLPPAFLDQLPAGLRPILGNGLIVGLVLVLLLEHVLLPERRKDSSAARGLPGTGFSVLGPGPGRQGRGG